MFISFVIFLILLILLSLFWYFFNFFNRNYSFLFKKIKNWMTYSSLVISIVLVIIYISVFNFNQNNILNNNDTINISLLSYIFTNSLIISFFIIILLSVPVRSLLIAYKFYNDKSLFWKYLKKYLLYGTIAILSCLIIYAFNNLSAIFFDHTFNKIDSNNIYDNNLYQAYLSLKNIINIIFKSKWLGWIYIGYHILLLIFAFIWITKKNIYFYHIKCRSLIKYSNNLSIFTIPMAFSGLVSTLLLNYQSLIFRILILFLIITFFLFISLFIFKLSIKKNMYNLITFNSGVIMPIFLIAYLAISNNYIFNLSILLNLNFWICLFIGSYINGMFHFDNDQNITLSKFNLSYFTPYVCSGINTSPLTYISPLIEYIFKLHNNISII